MLNWRGFEVFEPSIKHLRYFGKRILLDIPCALDPLMMALPAAVMYIELHCL